MKRAFMYSNCNFPRGSASANYLQYLGMALIEIGYEVYLIANGSYDKCQYNEDKDLYEYQGITFVKLNDQNNVVQKLTNKVFPVLEFTDFAKQQNPEKGDLLIAYTSDAKKLKALLSFAKQNDMKSAACIVEWFPKELYTRGSYEQYQQIFDEIYPQFDLLLPISQYIADYLDYRGGKCFVLPIMADPYEYNVAKSKDFSIRKFLFIKNGMMKDCAKAVFDALNGMSPNEFNKSEFHFKGYKEDDLKKMLIPELWPLIGRQIIPHGWMEYDELIDLYADMTFLLLPREENQMTLANFPSKVPEVMCFGVVPVVSDVGDYTKSYLKDGIDSLFIRECSGAGCMYAIRRAAGLSDKEIEGMSKQAEKTVIERFDFRVWKKRISDVLKNIETN